MVQERVLQVQHLMQTIVVYRGRCLAEGVAVQVLAHHSAVADLRKIQEKILVHGVLSEERKKKIEVRSSQKIL